MRVVRGINWYRPREIARLGLIRNSTGGDNEDSNYNFILEQIKAGRIKAKNYSTGRKLKFWLISEREIERYHKEES